MGTIAAEPGWQAVYLHHGDEGTVVQRWPVVAWVDAGDDKDAVVIAPSANGTIKVARAAHLEQPKGAEFVGFFHPDWLTESKAHFHGEAEWLAVARDRYVQRVAKRA